MTEQNLHAWILLKEDTAQYEMAGKIAINEAVLNGVLFHPDGTPMSNTCREIVRWLASVKSFAWSVNGGKYRLSWWLTRMGMDVSRSDFERSLKILRQVQVITVTTTPVEGGRVPMTTYSLSPEFRRYCTRYLKVYTQKVSRPGSKNGLVAAHRRYEEEDNSKALRSVAALLEALNQERCEQKGECLNRSHCPPEIQCEWMSKKE